MNEIGLKNRIKQIPHTHEKNNKFALNLNLNINLLY